MLVASEPVDREPFWLLLLNAAKLPQPSRLFRPPA
jgi:hypothetical protein